MQKTVIPSPKILLGVVDSETDGRGGVVVALLCREPVVNYSFAAHINELSQRLVRYCSVEDATLEGAFCCIDDSVVNIDRTHAV